MKEFFLTLTGAICSVIGGCIAIWYQAKKSRQIRMEEVKGEHLLEACKKALFLTGRIQTLSDSTDDILCLLSDNDEWFCTNQMLLPHTFVENWLSVRHHLRQAKGKDNLQQKIPDGTKRDNLINSVLNTEDFVRELVSEMDKAIRKELGLKEVNIKRPDSTKGQ